MGHKMSLRRLLDTLYLDFELCIVWIVSSEDIYCSRYYLSWNFFM